MRSPTAVTTVIQSLSHDGRGITSINDKVTFVHNALPGETVRMIITRAHRRYNEAHAIEIIEASCNRVSPPCPHSEICGGCSLQHLSPNAQITFREQSVKEQLLRIGQVTPDTWLPPITSPDLGYRRKARLGVRFVHKKDKLLIGFREKKSNYLADMDACHVLDPRIGLKLTNLATLVRTLEAFESIPQIEVAASDTRVALIFRHMQTLSANDTKQLIAFGQSHHFHIYLQPGSPDTIYKIYPNDDQNFLSYHLPAHDVTFQFHPTDFTQVNHIANQGMVDQAIHLLAVEAHHTVLDLFCGLGNFSLPIAKKAALVVGVEGCANMVKRATDNAARNHLSNTAFYASNLMEPHSEAPWLKQTYDSILLDPPRTGAKEIIPFIAQNHTKRIVYISCNPATLARDAGMLVNQYGYQLVSAGIINMFPHTGHIETMALFEKVTQNNRKQVHGQRQTNSPPSY